MATRFRVENGRVAELARYEAVAVALRAAGLGEDDRLAPVN